ncbi:sulfurtransferase TusA family protein [Pseudogemmobacter bohemicus]|uniref:sulfurtransferase TusA family protein n=1 Tax=Pseudogemmobacter bohemicus TaxID=2250708 RepID=UPI000DD49562|nr:sulfurtransferase TusA family protein [Pseudogemmobacter bohemicus]
MSQAHDQDLDCEGLLCPLPVLRARKRLLAIAPGAVLRVRTTDRMAMIDLPHFCAGAGHDYLGFESAGAVTLHLIRRGPDKPAADPPG